MFTSELGDVDGVAVVGGGASTTGQKAALAVA